MIELIVCINVCVCATDDDIDDDDVDDDERAWQKAYAFKIIPKYVGIYSFVFVNVCVLCFPSVSYTVRTTE